jgi:hypothetical protein
MTSPLNACVTPSVLKSSCFTIISFLRMFGHRRKVAAAAGLAYKSESSIVLLEFFFSLHGRENSFDMREEVQRLGLMVEQREDCCRSFAWEE